MPCPCKLRQYAVVGELICAVWVLCYDCRHTLQNTNNQQLTIHLCSVRSFLQFLPNDPLSPYLSNINIYRKKKSRKSLEIWVLFITFAFVILRIANNELLALICRLALFYGNGVYCVFLLMYWKLGTSKWASDKEQGGRLHLACIYMAQMRPFVKKGCILCYSSYTSNLA